MPGATGHPAVPPPRPLIGCRRPGALCGDWSTPRQSVRGAGHSPFQCGRLLRHTGNRHVVGRTPLLLVEDCVRHHEIRSQAALRRGDWPPRVPDRALIGRRLPSVSMGAGPQQLFTSGIGDWHYESHRREGGTSLRLVAGHRQTRRGANRTGLSPDSPASLRCDWVAAPSVTVGGAGLVGKAGVGSKPKLPQRADRGPIGGRGQRDWGRAGKAQGDVCV